MKKKRNQCYLLLGSILMLLVACLCSATFVKDNLNHASEKKCFESIYKNTSIDYIVPGPSFSQIEEIEKSNSTGITAITPYYETTTEVVINGKPVSGTSILFPFVEKIQFTPYCPARISAGAVTFGGGDAIVDQAYADRNNCDIGDLASILIAGHEYKFTIKSIAEKNTFYESGTIALILSADQASEIESAGIKYSAAYISASDQTKCKAYLYSEYKPLARLKDRSEFESDDVYSQHLQNFNDADWSKEITNCQENYKALSVKYENVQASITVNIGIMTVIVAIVIIVFNSILLTKDSIKSFMKTMIVKKSGTKKAVKKFYRTGITANMILFCLACTWIYIFLAQKTHTQLFDLQAANCVIPCLVAIISSVLMIGITSSYVEKHYKIRTVKRSDSTEEIRVEVV